MCARFTFLSYDEVADVIREMRMTSVLSPPPDWPAVRVDAYPKSPVTVIRPTMPPEMVASAALRLQGPGPALPEGARASTQLELPLEPATLQWGFEAEWQRDVIFNTRIESAGKPFWRESLEQRRCLVPAFGFYEPHQSETVTSPRTGRQIKRSYYFTDPDDAILLMGGIWKDDRFSILTTEPNAVVAPVHRRMPLIVRPDELSVWFGGDWRALADRRDVALVARAQESNR